MIDEATPPPRARRWLKLVGTIASLGLLAWMLSRQDWQAIRAYAAGIPLASLALALAFVFGAQALSALRWWILMHEQRISVDYPGGFRLTASGMFASNFLPGTIGGDLIRIAGILPRSPGTAVAIASVVVDRIVGVVGMVCFLPLSIATFGPVLVALGDGSPAASAATIGWRGSVGRWWGRFVEVVRPWLARPRSLVGALAAALLSIVAYNTSVWLVARGLGMQVTLVDVASVTGITYFLSQIPISFNALGVREAAMIALYGQLGSTPEQAAALALITRALVMLSTVPGAIWLPSALAEARRAKEAA